MELENWNWKIRIGKLELENWNWKIGIGKLELGKWETGKLGNGIVTWNWAIELGDAEDFSFKMSKFIV